MLLAIVMLEMWVVAGGFETMVERFRDLTDRIQKVPG